METVGLIAIGIIIGYFIGMWVGVRISTKALQTQMADFLDILFLKLIAKMGKEEFNRILEQSAHNYQEAKKRKDV